MIKLRCSAPKWTTMLQCPQENLKHVRAKSSACTVINPFLASSSVHSRRHRLSFAVTTSNNQYWSSQTEVERYWGIVILPWPLACGLRRKQQELSFSYLILVSWCWKSIPSSAITLSLFGIQDTRWSCSVSIYIQPPSVVCKTVS